MLQTSDNYLTEVLGRMAAVAGGKPGSNDGATAAVLQQLAGAGHRHGTASASPTSPAWRWATRSRPGSWPTSSGPSPPAPTPRLRAALAASRWQASPARSAAGTRTPPQRAGAGLVRAKTGTLNTVIALSGYVVDADGRLLVFSFIGNGLTPGAAEQDGAGPQPRPCSLAAAAAEQGCRRVRRCDGSVPTRCLAAV